jgi:hypothetical protein
MQTYIMWLYFRVLSSQTMIVRTGKQSLPTAWTLELRSSIPNLLKEGKQAKLHDFLSLGLVSLCETGFSQQNGLSSQTAFFYRVKENLQPLFEK